jgi:hypothetical protein
LNTLHTRCERLYICFFFLSAIPFWFDFIVKQQTKFFKDFKWNEIILFCFFFSFLFHLVLFSWKKLIIKTNISVIDLFWDRKIRFRFHFWRKRHYYSLLFLYIHRYVDDKIFKKIANSRLVRWSWKINKASGWVRDNKWRKCVWNEEKINSNNVRSRHDWKHNFYW